MQCVVASIQAWPLAASAIRHVFEGNAELIALPAGGFGVRASTSVLTRRATGVPTPR